MSRYRITAAVLAGSSLLSVLVAAHHPRTMQAGHLDEITHGLLIVAAIAIECAVILYALRPGTVRTQSVIAVVLSALGTIGIVFAGCIDGFFVPWFHAYVAAGSVDARAARAVLRAAWIAIQILSKFSFIAIGCAGTLLSVEMLAEPHPKIAGAVGTLAAMSLVAFAAIGGPLGPHNLFFAGIALATWCCALAYRIPSITA